MACKEIREGSILHAEGFYGGVWNEFYIVTERTEHTATIQKLKKITVSDDGYGQNGTETFIGLPDMREKPLKKKVSVSKRGDEYVTVNCSMIAEPINPKENQPYMFQSD
jgi:hypothetical protein